MTDQPVRPWRRRWRVWLIAGLAFIAVGYIAFWATTDTFTWSRAVVWRSADTGDIDRFPARSVPAGGEILALERGEPLDLAAAMSIEDPDRFLEETDTAALLVVQDGVLRHEQYLGDNSATTLRTSFSVAKSVLSTLIGLAIEDGLIDSVDQPITDFLPELVESDPRYADITIRHLLSMSSGLRYEEGSFPWSDDTQTYYSTDLRRTARSSVVVGPPGETFLYNNYNPLLEGLILERAVGMHVTDYLSERLWKPMGAEADGSWSLDSEESGFEKMESGLNAVARDYARFGILFANEGRVGERQVVSEGWVREATSRDSGPVGFYALHWWTGGFDRSLLPRTDFMAAGNHGQFIYVAPDDDIVIVRLGDKYGTDDWPQRLASIADYIRNSS